MITSPHQHYACNVVWRESGTRAAEEQIDVAQGRQAADERALRARVAVSHTAEGNKSAAFRKDVASPRSLLEPYVDLSVGQCNPRCEEVVPSIYYGNQLELYYVSVGSLTAIEVCVLVVSGLTARRQRVGYHGLSQSDKPPET